MRKAAKARPGVPATLPCSAPPAHQPTPPSSTRSSSGSPSHLSSGDDAVTDPVVVALRLVHGCRARASHPDDTQPPGQTRYSVALSTEQYESLRAAIDADTGLSAWAADKLRSSWVADRASGRFVVRMPTPLHDTFASALEHAIHKSIRRLAKGKTGTQPGTADVARLNAIQRLATSDAKRGKEQKSADGGFGVPSSARHLVAIEVGYSQDAAGLRQTVDEWVKLGANAVLIVDIAYSNPIKRKSLSTPPSTTYTLYRVQRYDDGGIGKKRAVKEQIDVEFARSPNEHLELRLSDFCLPNDTPTTDHAIRLGHDVMTAILQSAYGRQQLYDQESGFSSDNEVAPTHSDEGTPVPARSSKRNKVEEVAATEESEVNAAAAGQEN